MAGKIFGLAKWILDADNRKLNRKAKESEEAIKDVGEAADKSAQKVSKLGKAGEGIDKRTEGIRKFTGALGAAIGAVTGLIAVIGVVVGSIALFYKWLKRSQEAAEGAAKEYRSLSDELDGLFEQVNDGEIISDEQLDNLDAMRRGSENLRRDQKNWLFGKQQELEYENQILVAREKQRLAGKANFDEASAMRSQIEAINAELSDDSVRESEKLRHRERMRNLDAEWEASTRTNPGLFDALIEAEDRLHAHRLANIDTEEKKKAQELAERIAAEKRASEERMAAERESTIKAAQDAAEAYAKQLTRSTGDFTTRLDSILNAVRDVSRVSGRR